MKLPSRTLCLVDDDDFYSEILCELLQCHGYKTVHFKDSSIALEHFTQATSENTYDAILLDILMPDIDGYELCRRCRNIPHLNGTPILFVSSQTSLEDQIKGYENGGDDFLTKPVQAEVLNAKLGKAIAALENNKALEQQANQAREMMNQAISSVNEMEIVAQFINRCVECETSGDVAQAFLKTAQLLGVQCSCYIRSEFGAFFDSIDGARKAIEVELLEMANRSTGPIAFNGRLILNQPFFSILVRRMPDEPLKQDRLTEQLNLLISVANSRIMAIDKALRVEKHQKLIQQVIHKAESAVSELISSTEEQEQVIKDVTEEFLMRLKEDLLDLALDKDQEKILLEMVRKNVCQITDMLMENKQKIEQINEPFQAVIRTLNET